MVGVCCLCLCNNNYNVKIYLLNIINKHIHKVENEIKWSAKAAMIRYSRKWMINEKHRCLFVRFEIENAFQCSIVQWW